MPNDKRNIRTGYRIAYHTGTYPSDTRYGGRVTIYTDPVKLYNEGVIFMDLTNKEYAVMEQNLDRVGKWDSKCPVGTP